MSPAGVTAGGIWSGMKVLYAWPRSFHPVATALSERGQRHSTSRCPDRHSEHHVGTARSPWGTPVPVSPTAGVDVSNTPGTVAVRQALARISAMLEWSARKLTGAMNPTGPHPKIRRHSGGDNVSSDGPVA